MLVHSGNQLDEIRRCLPHAARDLAVVPYAADVAFWTSSGAHHEEDGLVASAGREHRDYATLVAARPLDGRLVIADHSVFSPRTTRRLPDLWPEDVERCALEPTGLRDLYERASVVVVPVVETNFPAGVTTLLEAMSLGKAVISTATEGLRGVVDHGRTGLTVPPGDVEAMRRAIAELLGCPALRAELGRAAQREVADVYDVRHYANALAAHMTDLGTCGLSLADTRAGNR
jgi:glycosyltransferase involved in cell wall biosynthesis